MFDDILNNENELSLEEAIKLTREIKTALYQFKKHIGREPSWAEAEEIAIKVRKEFGI
jgi:hypothetical protein